MRHLDTSLAADSLVDELLDIALDLGASDVHVDPGSPCGVVRLRIDGVLFPLASVPSAVLERVVGRLKVLARLVVYQFDRIQEGRLTVARGGARADVRLTILPTPEGERAALRVFPASNEPPRLAELGFGVPIVDALRAVSRSRRGLLAVTGPMSSGKTTTLHALATAIVAEDGARHLVASVEDPVERRLAGVIQLEVAPERGITFETGLATLLRHDVSVLVVGEIRDGATAARAVDAALTGHLVLTTFHVGSPREVLERLSHLGVERRLVPSAVVGILSQRLFRLLCRECRVVKGASAPPLPGARLSTEDVVTAAEAGPGCSGCRGTGYRGRTARGEWVPFDPSIADLSGEAWESELRRREIPSLADEAGELLFAGFTSYDEALRGLRS